MFSKIQENEHIKRLKLLFSPWPIKKRLRLLSDLAYPLPQEFEDTCKMFLSIPIEEWSETYFKQNPAILNKVYSISTLEDLHDLMVVVSRKRSVPLKSMNQNPILFLEQEDFGERYSVRVPRSNHDLDMISYRLNNCVGRAGYYEKVMARETFIIEVLKDKKSYACIEFHRPARRIIQSKINRNQPFPDVEFIRSLELKIKNKLYPSVWSFIKDRAKSLWRSR